MLCILGSKCGSKGGSSYMHLADSIRFFLALSLKNGNSKLVHLHGVERLSIVLMTKIFIFTISGVIIIYIFASKNILQIQIFYLYLIKKIAFCVLGEYADIFSLSLQFWPKFF